VWSTGLDLSAAEHCSHRSRALTGKHRWPAPAVPPATISLGQTTDQVVSILGQPKNIVDLGPKKIYVYPDIKVTFNNGKVTDVE